ncbi:OsmC family protein [Zobellia roscoffensis]
MEYKLKIYQLIVFLIPTRNIKIMATTNHITTKWLGNMQFESTNPSGLTLNIDAGPDDGGEGKGLRPKALMLSGLAGCSGLDVAALIKKMKLEVDDFHIETIANLTDEHPKFYDAVTIEYHFHGNNLAEKKLQRAVDLSVEKYCGVMEMFRQFAKLEIKTIFHKE